MQPSIIETDREADNDAATVRSPSMRTYREGDDHGLTGLAALSSREKPRHEARLSQSGMVPGPTRVTLRDEGAVEGKRDSERSMGIQINISDHEGSPDQAEAGKGSQALENTTGASRYAEVSDIFLEFKSSVPLTSMIDAGRRSYSATSCDMAVRLSRPATCSAIQTSSRIGERRQDTAQQ